MRIALETTLKSLAVAATALLLLPAALRAQSQPLPAGIQGYWKITKMLPKKPMAMPGCASDPGFFSSMSKKSRVLLSDSAATWGGTSSASLAPTVSNMNPGDFSAQYLRGGATMKDLGLGMAAKVEVVQFGAPGNLPFDTVIVKDPSTLYFERCGIFMEAVHDGGFIAPPLPNQQ